MTVSAEVEGLYGDLLSAWNERDAHAWGACFTDDGTLVGFDSSPVDAPASIVELQALVT